MSVLNNIQNAHGYILVKDNVAGSGLGSSKQEYRYNDDNFYYFKKVSSSNYTILMTKKAILAN